MLVTLILRFIHFVGLCLGKNTSGTISRTPARFSENQACTCYRVRSRLSHSHHRYPKLCSVAEGLDEIFRFKRTMAQLLYLYDHSKAARRILISGHPGRLIYSKLGETLGRLLDPSSSAENSFTIVVVMVALYEVILDILMIVVTTNSIKKTAQLSEKTEG